MTGSCAQAQKSCATGLRAGDAELPDRSEMVSVRWELVAGGREVAEHLSTTMSLAFYPPGTALSAWLGIRGAGRGRARAVWRAELGRRGPPDSEGTEAGPPDPVVP